MGFTLSCSKCGNKQALQENAISKADKIEIEIEVGCEKSIYASISCLNPMCPNVIYEEPR